MKKDLLHLSRLQDFYAQHRVLPSYSTIAQLVGLKSKSSVAALVTRLRQQGYIDMTPGHRLAPTPRFFERPLENTVRAGFPTPATDALSDSVTLDEYLIEKPSQTVLVTVKGDSMVEAGIFPNDIAIVERRPSAKVGEIVVAIVDNEFTLKYLERDNDGFYLRPANPAYPNIRARGQLEIFGFMVGLVRKYQP